MKLRHKFVREVKPTVPFDFDATFHKPAHFPSGDNYWEPGVRWQTFRFGGMNLGVIFKNVGSVEKPKIKVKIYSADKLPNEYIEQFIDEIELRKKDRNTQMKELLKLYGVGPATVWYLLFDVFHQWDFFNHISPWEQKIYSKLFFDKDPKKPVSVKKLLKHFEKYGEYKQLAVHYIWEDLWWKRKNQHIPWLEKLIRI